MLTGFLQILLFQLLGEVLTRITGLPVPGPVVGMVLLFVWLQWRRPQEDAGVLRAGDALLQAMPLFFVPAAVGFVVYAPQLANQWVPALFGALGSWLVVLLATAGVALALRRRHHHRRRTSGAA